MPGAREKSKMFSGIAPWFKGKDQEKTTTAAAMSHGFRQPADYRFSRLMRFFQHFLLHLTPNRLPDLSYLGDKSRKTNIWCLSISKTDIWYYNLIFHKKGDELAAENVSFFTLYFVGKTDIMLVEKNRRQGDWQKSGVPHGNPCRRNSRLPGQIDETNGISLSIYFLVWQRR